MVLNQADMLAARAGRGLRAATCGGCSTPRTCTTCRSWSPPPSPGPASTRCARCWPRPSRPAARPPPASPPTWTPSSPGSCPTPGRNRRPMTVPRTFPGLAGGRRRVRSRRWQQPPGRGQPDRRRHPGRLAGPARRRVRQAAAGVRHRRRAAERPRAAGRRLRRLAGELAVRAGRASATRSARSGSGKLWAELRGVTAGPSGAQQAEIDNSLTELADEVSPGAAQALVADHQDRHPVPGRRHPRRSRPADRRGAPRREQDRRLVARHRRLAGPAARLRHRRHRLDRRHRDLRRVPRRQRGAAACSATSVCCRSSRC